MQVSHWEASLEGEELGPRWNNAPPQGPFIWFVLLPLVCVAPPPSREPCRLHATRQDAESRWSHQVPTPLAPAVSGLHGGLR